MERMKTRRKSPSLEPVSRRFANLGRNLMFGWENPAKRPAAYADIADLPEDDRIKVIAEQVTATPGAVVGFIVDSHPIAERYLRKLAKLQPGIMQVERKEHDAGLNVVLVRIVYRRPVAS